MYEVWWKRQDKWKCLLSTFDPIKAERYAMYNVAHGHITQRIEVRDVAANSRRLIYVAPDETFGGL